MAKSELEKREKLKEKKAENFVIPSFYASARCNFL